MRKTIALFAFALVLLTTAFFLFLITQWRPSQETPPEEALEMPPVSAPRATSSLRLGDVVVLDARLGNSRLLIGTDAPLGLVMDLKAPVSAEGVGRAPMAVALVLDRSGSMAGEKIERARQAAKDLVHRLDDADRIALVTYASDYSEDIPLTRIKGQRERIARAIDAILDGGGTNLSGGLECGLRALAAHNDTSTIKRLILLSDGNANQGITDPETLASKSAAARSQGITISTLGVGVDFNEDLMTLIAESGGGGYYYARSAMAIAKAFDAEVQGLLKIAARNVEVALELPEGVSIKEVYGYRTELRGGRTVLSVGDMASEEKRRIVVELEVKNVGTAEIPIAGIVLSHGLSKPGDTREHHGNLSAIGSFDFASIEATEDRDVSEAIEEAVAARARAEAAASYQRGHREHAQRMLETQIQTTRSRNAVLQSSALQAQVNEMEETLKNILSVESASEAGRDLIKSEKLRARELMAY